MNALLVLLYMFTLILQSLLIHASTNLTLMRRQALLNPVNSQLQPIAMGLVAPIHIVQSPRTGKIIFLERVNGGSAGTTHSQEFDPYSLQSRPLHLLTDTFCSAGFISPDPQGRIFNVGGWDGPALEAVRVLTPCGAPGQFGNCDWYENANVAALKVPR
jgi:hypothetical protein